MAGYPELPQLQFQERHGFPKPQFLPLENGANEHRLRGCVREREGGYKGAMALYR